MESAVQEHLQTAIQFHQRGDIHKADEHYRVVLNEDRENVDMLHFYGLLQYQHGDMLEGLAMMELAVHLQPDYYDALNNLGNVMVKENRLDEARGLFLKCISLNPDAIGPMVNLGAVMKKKGDIAGAINMVKQAMIIEPNYPLAHASLIDLYTINKDYDEALSVLDKTLDQGTKADDEKTESFYHSRGGLLYLVGRKEEARALYNEFVERYPQNSVARHMSVAMSGEGAPEKPEEEYVRDIFDRFADNFDQVLANLDYRAPELVGLKVKERYDTSESSLSILDAGCGTGLCGEYLRPYANSLVGIDLSGGMLQKAELTEQFDELIEVEIEEFLAKHPQEYHLIVSADTLCYFGSLKSVFDRMINSLDSGGSTIFTVETTVDELPDGFRLQDNGRYQHDRGYVELLLKESGFVDTEIDEVVLRSERGQPVNGLLISASKS